MNAQESLIIELSSSKIGYAIYAANGQILDDKILGDHDTGKIQLSTKAAVQGDPETQDTITDQINAVRDAAQQQGIDSYRIISTSAFRDGEYASEAGRNFAAHILNETGLSVDILTGEEEAQYIASAILSDPDISVGEAQPSLLIDMGGRSTEFIATNEKNTITKIKSYPFGRLTPPEDAHKIIVDALDDFTTGIDKPDRVIYSGSIFRKSVREFNKASNDHSHSLFTSFMGANTASGRLATTIDFPVNSVHVADQLANTIEQEMHPAIATTSAAKVPQGAVILHPERLKQIPQPAAPSPTLGL